MNFKSVVQWLNKTFDFTYLLRSRIILYFLFILSISHLYFFTVMGDYVYAVIFLLVGFLVSFFSKNMIVIMCFALAISYTLRYGTYKQNYENMSTMEGMTGEGMTDEGMTGESMTGEGMTDTDTSLNKFPEKPIVLDGELSKPGETTTNIADSIKDLAKPVKPPKGLSPGADKNTQLEYKKLLELQLKVIDGISNLQPILSEVATKIDDMKSNVNSGRK